MKRQFLIVLAATVAIVYGTAPARSDEILVSAAASLTDAFNEIGKTYTMRNRGSVVRFNFGASGALQQQIMQGAPVDVFASASPKEMDALQSAHRVEPGTRNVFAGNRLVLIIPSNGMVKRWDDLRSASVRRIAISNPDSVPSGRYAKETLTKRGLWAAIEPKAVLGENVRQTLTYVAGGNVDAGIVFATDALIEKQRVRIVDSAVSGKDHSPIVYPAAVISGAPNMAGARKFVSFLLTAAAQEILAKYGFTRASISATNRPTTPASQGKHSKHSSVGRR